MENNKKPIHINRNGKADIKANLGNNFKWFVIELVYLLSDLQKRYS